MKNPDKVTKPIEVEPELIEAPRLANTVFKMRVQVTDAMSESVKLHWQGWNTAVEHVMRSIKRASRRRRGVREASEQRVAR